MFKQVLENIRQKKFVYDSRTGNKIFFFFGTDKLEEF